MLIATGEIEEAEPLSDSSNPKSIGELVLALKAAHARMGVSNPHRTLVGQCAFALVYLAQENMHLKAELAPLREKESQSRIVLASHIGNA